MKKRILSLLIAVLIALTSLPAWADSADGRGNTIVRNETLAAYVDGYGNLYIPGREQPVNDARADQIVSIDPYRLIFLSKTGEVGAEKSALISLDLTKMTETTVSSDVRAACVINSEDLYYIETANRTQLMRLNFASGKTAIAYTSSEQMDGLYETAEGLVVSYVDNAGAVVQNAVTGLFEPYDGAFPTKSAMIDDCQVYLANGSDLYAFRSGSASADLVDTNVYDFAVLDGKAYYLANTGSAVRLKSYDPAKMEWKVLSTPEISLEKQVAASTSRLFVLGTDHVIYTVDLGNGALAKFAAIDAPSLSSDQKVNSYSIEAMSGQLNVYANIGKANESPTFTFMEFTSDASSASDETRVLIKTHTLSDEIAAWTLLEPAKPFTTLKRGSRGEAVSDMQQPLYDLGYYDYYIDGIFGWRTERAIRLLQSDLGLKVTGVADADLQKQILSGTLEKYDPYRALNRGDRGLRVQTMQQRLRDLGYLADAADSIFGPRTQQAVQLFQQENGVSVSESATRETLIALYNENAESCSSYINLRLGDSGYRVRELNKRLKELFYLDGTAGNTYTEETAEAIKKFQSQAGLYITGNATPSVQQRLFTAGAPEYNGYVLLVRGDENSRVTNLQRRLKELGYYTGSLDGYFGKGTQNAVKLFQQFAGIRPSGKATVETQKLLFSPDAPKYVEPTIISVPNVSIDCYEQRANDGTYLLTDRCSETGVATLSWYALGDVDHYNILITDEKGTKYLSQDTNLNMTGVPINALELNRVYTLTVTAYPKDGNASHVTSAKLSFKRIETPVEPDPVGTITDLVTVIDPVNRVDSDISYVRKGALKLRWYALGDVASYYVEIRDSKNNVLVHAATTDEEASISTDSMTEGEVYSFVVYAIPTNGTMDDATVRTQRFAIDPEVKPIPTVNAPKVTVEGVSPDASGAYTIEETGATFRWDAVENAEQYYIEVRDSANALFTSETTTATGYVLNPSAMTRGEAYTLIVTAIPEGGALSDGASTALVIRVRENQEIKTLDAPVLSIAGLEPASDGIVYSDSASLTFQWTAVEGASAYNLVIRDSTGALVKEATLMQQSVTFEGTELTRGAVYTVSVTALPEDELHAQGKPATLPFIIRIQKIESADTPVAFDQEPTPVIEVVAPAIELKTFESVDGSVTYLEKGTVEMSWHSESNVSGYEVTLLDSEGNVLNSMTTKETAASFDSSAMTPGAVYTLRVTAIPEDGSTENGATSEVWFAVRAEQPTEEPVVTEEPTVEPEITEEPTEEPTAEPTDQPTAEPALAAPELTIDPVDHVENDVTYVSGDVITFGWHSEGAEEYVVEIYDSNGKRAEQTTDQLALSLSTDNLTAGETYSLVVTAVSGELRSESAAMSFALATPKITEEPTAEPEITEEPTAEPEITEEPTVSEIGVPVIDIQPAIENDGSLVRVSGDTVSFAWSAEGDVQGYRVELLDGENTMQSMTTESLGVAIDAHALETEKIYTFRVTAIPADSAASEQTAQMNFAVAAPEITEAPTEEPTVEPTEEPTVATISAPEIHVETVDYTDGNVNYVAEGNLTFTWTCEGSVSGYNVELLDENGTIAAQPMTDSAIMLATGNMNPGTIYTLRVTAIPENGTEADGVSSELYFALPIPEVTEAPTPEPTEEPTPEPTEVPVEEPTEAPVEEPTTEPEPEPTDAPAYVEDEEAMINTNRIGTLIWDTPIDATSDPEMITLIQNRLVEWGWLAKDTFLPGQMDDATCMAVWNLQNYINLTAETPVELINADTRTIGLDTLSYLTTLMIDEYTINPTPVTNG